MLIFYCTGKHTFLYNKIYDLTARARISEGYGAWAANAAVAAFEVVQE